MESRSSLNASLPSPLPMTDSPSKALEREFCKRFECCAIVFTGLHDLMAHYEQDHGKLVSSQSQFTLEEMYHRAFRAAGSDYDARCVPMVDICKRAVVNIMDPQMDIDSDDSLSSSYAEPLPTALKRRTNRPGFSNKKRKSNIVEESDVDVDIITVDDDDFVKKVDSLTILPPTPPTSDVESEGIFKYHPAVKAQIWTPNLAQQVPKIKKPRQSSLSVLDPETGERKYVCAVEDCKKQYKNANGLKYHLSHAHPDGQGVPKEYMLFQRKKEEDGYRPYFCTIEGCTKKYKNLNGLKYHIEHYHSSLLPASNPAPSQQAQTPLATMASVAGHLGPIIPFPHIGIRTHRPGIMYPSMVFPPAPGPQKGSQK